MTVEHPPDYRACVFVAEDPWKDFVDMMRRLDSSASAEIRAQVERLLNHPQEALSARVR